MLKILLIFLVVCLASLAGCAEATAHPDHDRAEVYAGKKPGERIVCITHREWVGLAGPHGLEGFRNIGYWITVAGAGPVFNNPKFEDNPSGIVCIGTVTLDSGNSKVIVDMQRVVSKPGEPRRTVPHPANGTYSVEAVFDAPPGGP